MSKMRRLLFEFPALACLVVGFLGSMASLVVWFICEYVNAPYTWIALAQIIEGVSIVLFTIGMVVPLTWTILYGENEGTDKGQILFTVVCFVFGLVVGTFLIL